MKVVISQCGLQTLVCGANVLFNVSTVETPEGEEVFSIGAGGASFGQYKSIDRAIEHFQALTEFLVSLRLVKFQIPKDPDVDAEDEENAEAEPKSNKKSGK